MHSWKSNTRVNESLTQLETCATTGKGPCLHSPLHRRVGRCSVDTIPNAKQLQNLPAVQVDTDPGAQILQLACLFVDAEVHVGQFRQGNGRRQAARAGADDSDAQLRRDGGGHLDRSPLVDVDTDVNVKNAEKGNGGQHGKQMATRETEGEWERSGTLIAEAREGLGRRREEKHKGTRDGETTGYG